SGTNGWSPAGRGPSNSRSHMSEPMPVTTDRPPSGMRNPTERRRPERSSSRSRTVSSAPSSTVTTRKIAASVSGVSIGCARPTRTTLVHPGETGIHGTPGVSGHHPTQHRGRLQPYEDGEHREAGDAQRLDAAHEQR